MVDPNAEPRRGLNFDSSDASASRCGSPGSRANSSCGVIQICSCRSPAAATPPGSGGRIHLSENTIKSHVQEIFRKLDVGNRVQAALKASKEGRL